VIYVTTAWSKIYAYDAKTGKQLWQFDPKVPGDWAAYACLRRRESRSRGVNGKSTSARSMAASSPSMPDRKSVWDVDTTENVATATRSPALRAW